MFKCVAENKLKPLNIFYPDLEFQVREISKTLYFHFENNVMRLIIFFFLMINLLYIYSLNRCWNVSFLCFFHLPWINFLILYSFWLFFFYRQFCFGNVSFFSHYFDEIFWYIISNNYNAFEIAPIQLNTFPCRSYLFLILWFSCYRFSQTR